MTDTGVGYICLTLVVVAVIAAAAFTGHIEVLGLLAFIILMWFML